MYDFASYFRFRETEGGKRPKFSDIARVSKLTRESAARIAEIGKAIAETFDSARAHAQRSSERPSRVKGAPILKRSDKTITHRRDRYAGKRETEWVLAEEQDPPYIFFPMLNDVREHGYDMDDDREFFDYLDRLEYMEEAERESDRIIAEAEADWEREHRYDDLLDDDPIDYDDDWRYSRYDDDYYPDDDWHASDVLEQKEALRIPETVWPCQYCCGLKSISCAVPWCDNYDPKTVEEDHDGKPNRFPLRVVQRPRRQHVLRGDVRGVR